MESEDSEGCSFEALNKLIDLHPIAGIERSVSYLTVKKSAFIPMRASSFS